MMIDMEGDAAEKPLMDDETEDETDGGKTALEAMRVVTYSWARGWWETRYSF